MARATEHAVMKNTVLLVKEANLVGKNHKVLFMMMRATITCAVTTTSGLARKQIKEIQLKTSRRRRRLRWPRSGKTAQNS